MTTNYDYANKKVLITGGLGFIGSNLAARLVDLGADVLLVDSLIPTYGGTMQNIAGIKDKVRVNISDVRDPYSFRELVKGQDYIFNLAGQTSHMDSMSDPHTDLAINCTAQLSILETVREIAPEARTVYASTRQIYGRPQYLPVDEKHPLSPVDVNGINKLAGEGYHILYSQVYGLRSTCLRLTNTYGPHMRVKDARQTFVGIWVKNVLQNEKFQVWGGDQLRDFTYIDDCVEALLVAASSDTTVGKIYNLGGVEVLTLLQLADTLVNIVPGSEYIIQQYPEERKKIDIGDYYSDDSLFRKESGWSPKINVKDGLALTIDYYKEHLPQYL